MTTKTRFALLSALFLWASAFVGIRVCLQGYSPEGLALFRYIVASICMAIIYFRLPAKSKLNLKDKLALLAIGVIGIAIYNISLNYGELAVSSSTASFVISQSPLLTAIFATLFLGEKINFLRVVGFCTSIFGVGLIALSEKSSFNLNAGLFYILIATIVSGLYSVLQKPFLNRYHAISVTTYLVWGATLFLLIYTPKMQYDLLHASWQSTFTAIYLGIFPAALGYLAWSYVLSHIPAARAGSFLYFMPFMTTLLGWMYLNEIPVWMSLCGGLLAILGVWLVNHSYAKIPAARLTESTQVA